MKETKIIKWDNLKWLYQYLDTNEEVQEVSKYLKDNDLEIKVVSIGGPHGTCHMWLEDKDLTGNGHGKPSLLYHVRNYRIFTEIKDSKEFEEYLKFRDKYEPVWEYFRHYLQY